MQKILKPHSGKLDYTCWFCELASNLVNNSKTHLQFMQKSLVLNQVFGRCKAELLTICAKEIINTQGLQMLV